ncbi:MAG TPA: ABC transporter ATP-binding protein [Jatrophihabitans sp.]|jgi:putative spermidine/putrescine transport system ATP-binding protein
MTEHVHPAIRLKGLRKTFGPVVAVDQLDLDIADGEFFAMLGPSGSGKTTVLRMIAGFEEPTAGSIELDGADATTTPPFRRDVTTVFQDYALFPHMSVHQNVEYGLKVKKVARSERRRRVEDALELVHLVGYGPRKPGQLSGGQRQRVALARALVNRPRVLLLDEPLGALDLKLREEMQLELKAIQREVRITFILVTHDQDEALTLCDRLAVLHEGRIEQIGTAEEVYESPATRFVAEFVGTSNLIDRGTDDVVSIRPEKIAVLVGDDVPSPGHEIVSGTVRDTVYAGAETRVVVDTEHGALTALLLNTSAPRSVVRGEVVRLAWDPSAVRVVA